MDKDQKLMTVAELAQRLDIGQAKIRSMVRNGELPHLRVGNQPRFNWDEVVTALRNPLTEVAA